jgi:hypothetical protein
MNGLIHPSKEQWLLSMSLVTPILDCSPEFYNRSSYITPKMRGGAKALPTILFYN